MSGNSKGIVYVRKLSASGKELLNCGSDRWNSIKGTKIDTSATPLANQPSPYIKSTFDENKIGAVKAITVKAAHNGKEVFFYLEWKSDQPNYKIEDVDIFPDGVGLLFPFKKIKDTPIKEMGSKDYPTNSWYWRPDFERPKNQVAHGLSTSLYTKESSITADSEWKNGKWRVVLGRPFEVPEEAVKFPPENKMALGIAVWEGENGERGGVKAFSKEWRDLVFES